MLRRITYKVPPPLPPWEIFQRGSLSRECEAFRRDRHQKNFTIASRKQSSVVPASCRRCWILRLQWITVKRRICHDGPNSERRLKNSKRQPKQSPKDRIVPQHFRRTTRLHRSFGHLTQYRRTAPPSSNPSLFPLKCTPRMLPLCKSTTGDPELPVSVKLSCPRARPVRPWNVLTSTASTTPGETCLRSNALIKSCWISTFSSGFIDGYPHNGDTAVQSQLRVGNGKRKRLHGIRSLFYPQEREVEPGMDHGDFGYVFRRGRVAVPAIPLSAEIDPRQITESQKNARIPARAL